ncbi:glycosyltransferase [Komagataeibacter rhaeticus]|nr:glycosyltransferase [Komagataeibacter rhaeticus]
MVLSIVVSGRYLVWRFTSTLDLDGVLQGSLVLALAVGKSIPPSGWASRISSWPGPAAADPPLPEDEGTWPVIDVYVPTYNEDISIVRTTVLGCLSMDWPADRLNVYILDDGRRRAFRDFAGQVGAGYINRAENVHAKAGNLNHAIGVTSGDIIAIFDCDHVPVRGFLKRPWGGCWPTPTWPCCRRRITSIPRSLPPQHEPGHAGPARKQPVLWPAAGRE